MIIGRCPFERIWVFSDLHLNDPHSEFYSTFLRSLEEPSTHKDAVVLAGDVFDVFIGNSAYFINKYSTFFSALKRLSSRGVKLFYIQGNHDFHLQDAFKEVSIQILDSELVIGKIYIAHGDLVDQGDRGYLRLRALLRSAGIQWLVSVLPGKVVEAIGEFLSRPHVLKERELIRAPGESPRERPVFRRFAEEKKRQGFDFVILGHCHDLDDLQPFYFNMGYPPIHRQFLFYDSGSNSFRRRIFAGI